MDSCQEIKDYLPLVHILHQEFLPGMEELSQRETILQYTVIRKTRLL